MPKAETSLSELLHEIRRIEEHREVLTEKKIRKIYKQLLKEVNAFVAETYTLYADESGALTVAGLQRYAKLAWYIEEIERCCNSYLPDVSAEIKELVYEAYDKCYAGMAEAVNKAYDLTALNVRPEVMQTTIGNNIVKLTLPAILEKNRKEIVYEIKQTLSIGLMNGERYETMSRKLAERLDISYGKANNIVRTESHRNVEGGFMDCAEHLSEGLEGSDYIYAATWRTMEDERVRPQRRYKTKKGWKTAYSKNGANHVKMEGVTVKAGDLFDLGNGVKAKAPSHSGVAAHDCRCRCFLEYNLMTLKEFEEATGKTVVRAAVNQTTREYMDEYGIPDFELQRTTDRATFNMAIEDAIKSRPVGACVDAHPIPEMKDYKLFLSKNEMAGVAVKPDGDITSVFKNADYKRGGAVDDLIITARANGGTKMDCYGINLVNKYEKCGYVPVARVPFDPQYVSDPYLLKTHPDVYVMMKNTDTLEDVIKKNSAKAYKLSLQHELDNLPTYDYDDALSFRDNLLDIQENK